MVVLRAVAPCRAAENADLIIDAIPDDEIVHVGRVVDMVKNDNGRVEILMDEIKRYRINADGKGVEVPEDEPV